MDRIAYVNVEDGPTLRCRAPDGLAIHEGDQCIVEADHTLDFGRLGTFDPGSPDTTEAMPKILRRATLQDQSRAHESALRSKMAAETCKERATRYGLALRLVRIRFNFDRTVLTVLFTAEQRVDFREMVRELSEELNTRVEMLQVGVRDEAGIIGGLGSCGRKLCCATWLHDFASINVRMAKVQGLPLNPGTIGGLCGRLKCCLRYEYECYREMGRLLPREGATVECPAGRGRIIDRNVLAGKLKVRVEDRRVVECAACDVHSPSDRRDERDDEEVEGADDQASDDAALPPEE